MPTVTLEAIADDRMYIWYASFCVSGCNNDFNVLESPPLHSEISTGAYPPLLAYELNGALCQCGHWIMDSIYSRWSYFKHAILDPEMEEDNE